MLEAYIIDQIKREEEKRRIREDEQRPRVWQEIWIPEPLSKEKEPEPEQEHYKIEISMVKGYW